MKKLFSLAAIVIFSLSTNAQETPAPSSSMPGALGKIAAADDLFIVSITSDNWMNLPSTIEAKPLRSRGFSFLIMKEKMGKAGHFVQHGVHVRHDVVAVHEDLLIPRCAQRYVQHGAVFGDVDLISAEHRVDA